MAHNFYTRFETYKLSIYSYLLMTSHWPNTNFTSQILIPNRILENYPNDKSSYLYLPNKLEIPFDKRKTIAGNVSMRILSNLNKELTNFNNENKIQFNLPGNYTSDFSAFHQVLIVTYGRSGSTFLGDLLRSYPGAYYTFEPLYVFNHSKEKVSIFSKKTQNKKLMNIH